MEKQNHKALHADRSHKLPSLHYQENIMNFLSLAVLFCCLVAGSILPAQASAEKVPNEVGGFTLGTSIDEYEFISYRNFLKQVVIDKIPGFRKGIIEYGVCDRPGEIVKIKLKYLDHSKSFYKKLLKRYKKQFGEPDEYVGDSFGIVTGWKWRFRNNEGKRITMLLQHNLKNPDEVTGNMVKLHLPDQIEAERICFNKTCATRSPGAFGKAKGQLDWDESSWQNMIPR